MIPIWKDTYYTDTVSTLDYTIQLDGEVIYSGRAVKAPNATYLYIKLNDICMDYLNNNLGDNPFSSSTITNTESTRTFRLYDSSSNLLGTYDFFYCWDYETTDITSGSVMSDIINGHYDTGMYRMKTTLVSANYQTTINSYDSSYTTKACGNGALYYLNAKGGWDSFLIEGKIIRTDNYTKYNVAMPFDNNSDAFGEYTYNNTVSPAWEIHTGWLNDRESKRLAKNLLGSNRVYFHDLNTDELLPVVITDESGTYKTHKNQSGMVNYTINIKASQSRRRL